MQGLNNAISQSLLTRFLANIFGFLFLTVCLGVGAYEVLSTGSVNPLILSILSTGLGFVLHALALNQGVTLSAVKQPVAPPTIEEESKP